MKEFSNNNPQNKSLAEIREEAYKQGREDAIAEAIRIVKVLDDVRFSLETVTKITDEICKELEGMKGENG